MNPPRDIAIDAAFLVDKRCEPSGQTENQKRAANPEPAFLLYHDHSLPAPASFESS